MSDDANNADDLSEEEADALLDRLHQAITDTKAVPPWLTRFAHESHRLISFEGDLAEIVADSFVDETVGMRAAATARSVEFAIDVDGQQVSVALDVDGTKVRGALTPATATAVIVTESERVVLTTNERGFFSFTAPESIVRFELDVAGTAIRTDWIRLA